MNIEELTKPDLPALFDAHICGVHGVLSDGCKSFAPTLIIEVIEPLEKDHKRKYIAVVVADDFNEPEEKHAIMEKIGSELYHKQKLPLSVSMATECWLSNNRDGIAPSLADDRREAISIAALGIDGSADLQMMPFKRDKDQNIIEGPFVRYSEGQCEPILLKSFYRGFWKEYQAREKGRR